jgi:ATPase subunit of ABC transporter with duplicated ATPase domains
MIRLDNISKQIGHQILFIEASAALEKGEKVGLVGPNGAGKTTLFRMITGEEQPDEGQVAVDRGVTTGYFSQDVGEMSGRSAVAEVMDGAGPVSAVAAELNDLEAAMGDTGRADMDDIIARYGEVQARFEELDGYALEGRAREVLAGLSFSQEMMDGDVGALSGGWKMRVALARILLMRPDAMLLDEPSNHLDLESLIWLEQFLKGYEGVLFMTSHDREFMNRIIDKVVEIDGGQLTTYSGNYEFYEQQRARREAAAGPVRAPAGDARQGDQIHRALQGARLARRPGAEPGQEAGEDRAGGAAPAPPDGVVRFPPRPSLGRGRGEPEAGAKRLWQQAHL